MLKFRHRDWKWLRLHTPHSTIEHFHDRVGFTEVFEALGGYPDTDSEEWQEMRRWGDAVFGHSPFLSGDKTLWGFYMVRDQKVSALIRRPNDALAFKMRWC